MNNKNGGRNPPIFLAQNNRLTNQLYLVMIRMMNFLYLLFHKEPPSIRKLIPNTCLYSEDLMKLAINIAHESVRVGGGPFGAVIANRNGEVICVGYNRVVSENDSTSHAEINAIRKAQKKFGFDLSKKDLVLYTSSAPCIQCFGAIYLSGIKEVYSAATKEDVEKIGFKEGPTSDALWELAKIDKGILYKSQYGRSKEAIQVLQKYKKKGVIY